MSDEPRTAEANPRRGMRCLIAFACVALIAWLAFTLFAGGIAWIWEWWSGPRNS